MGKASWESWCNCDLDTNHIMGRDPSCNYYTPPKAKETPPTPTIAKVQTGLSRLMKLDEEHREIVKSLRDALKLPSDSTSAAVVDSARAFSKSYEDAKLLVNQAEGKIK